MASRFFHDLRDVSALHKASCVIHHNCQATEKCFCTEMPGGIDRGFDAHYNCSNFGICQCLKVYDDRDSKHAPFSLDDVMTKVTQAKRSHDASLERF